MQNITLFASAKCNYI